LDREQPLPAAAWSDQSAIDLADLVRDRQATPAAAAIGRELQVRFQAALDELDDTDREVVLLRHFEQLSNSETAEVLGLSPPAAGMRYMRAMRRLRLLLDEVPTEAKGAKPHAQGQRLEP
jgi:RNA polymerase sigma-70 factor (ECF subfamily)